MGGQPHVLVVPYRHQGHVAPLMKFSTKIAGQGIKVTFVTTEFIAAKVMASMPEKADEWSQIRLVSIPDGLPQGHDRKATGQFKDHMLRVMSGHLRDLIEKINQSSECEQISCVIADVSVGWALEVAKNMGIARAAFVPYGPGTLALSLHIPKLIEAGVIDTNGTSMNDELFSLTKGTLAWKSNEFPWSCPVDQRRQKNCFELLSPVVQTVRISNWLLSNSFYELDSPACDLVPNILPIGPLNIHSGNLAGSFWPEDLTCLNWLDKQPIGSVIYVAFGSSTIINQQQFDECALGLESLGKPFMWVVRPGLIDGTLIAGFLDGFTERVADRGKIVQWAPQEQVLAHSSVACFLSHCGWNSTMEGLSMGIPFLCWPYFADQFQNRNYICNVWKIGLELTPDKTGIVTRHEIQRKMEKLLSDDGIKANALKLKEMARRSVTEGGSSFKNFESFILQMKSADVYSC